MPNPYIGNGDAARYVEYYASPRMQRDAVYRLYNEGIQRRQESQRRAEEAVYPSQPRIYRTQKEIDDYVNAMVYSEVFRRQKKLAELEWELYHPTPTRYLTDQDMAMHVQHMYDQQLRKRERREREKQRLFGMTPIQKKEVQVREKFHELEENWRPPSFHVKYNDGKMLLVSELAAINSASPPSETQAGEARGCRHADPQRLQQLAQPLRVTPKLHKETGKDALMPPFRLFGDVIRKIEKRR
ncbi:hypothetical protein C3747_115g100 [Trypanosoma cruzi]|uniref:Uncharacterized protein n=2 Tax=Trypanosoma cruzi TaxID=5693 RepID=Q4D9K4_TRYCC|nr:hypothetical protein, conserved [Trypanosoma cruzi]EAN89206.1 hypothetical protein, conserved [Trypanosoma cruzi]PWV06440.1 hypothetical protein C3747_115g100 [Trypanosoma cruzi]RNC42443.1 hypothetical protein TcCL_NonESM07955 [Trypanosoma cruzi]|eukprot:XP_811057.1 hypothetical protein [Trypanosoma cruzi strain CL Brener]